MSKPAWAHACPQKLQLREAALGKPRNPACHHGTKQSFEDMGITKLELGYEGRLVPRGATERGG